MLIKSSEGDKKQYGTKGQDGQESLKKQVSKSKVNKLSENSPDNLEEVLSEDEHKKFMAGSRLTSQDHKTLKFSLSPIGNRFNSGKKQSQQQQQVCQIQNNIYQKISDQKNEIGQGQNREKLYIQRLPEIEKLNLNDLSQEQILQQKMYQINQNYNNNHNISLLTPIKSESEQNSSQYGSQQQFFLTPQSTPRTMFSYEDNRSPNKSINQSFNNNIQSNNQYFKQYQNMNLNNSCNLGYISTQSSTPHVSENSLIMRQSFEMQQYQPDYYQEKSNYIRQSYNSNSNQQQWGRNKNGRKQNRRSRNSLPINLRSSFSFDIIPEQILSDTRTSIMIQNIPNQYNKYQLIELIEKFNKDTYNFFYLPMDHGNQCNLGYAFINFCYAWHIQKFYQEFQNVKWLNYPNSSKRCNLRYARLQGLDALEQHFRFTIVAKNKMYRPLLINEQYSQQQFQDITRNLDNIINNQKNEFNNFPNDSRKDLVQQNQNQNSV